MCMGSRNSASRISPGWMGGLVAVAWAIGCLLVVVADLDGVGVAALPPKADAPLVVDADAVLASPVAGELLEPVAWRDAEVGERLGGVEDEELPEGAALEVGWPSTAVAPTAAVGLLFRRGGRRRWRRRVV
jgi:hypothetical protein